MNKKTLCLNLLGLFLRLFLNADEKEIELLKREEIVLEQVINPHFDEGQMSIGVLGGDPKGITDNYYVMLIKLSPNYKFQPHAYIEDTKIYILEGSVTIVQRLANGKEKAISLRAGDIFYLPAGAVIYSTTEKEVVAIVFGKSPHQPVSINLDSNA